MNSFFDVLKLALDNLPSAISSMDYLHLLLFIGLTSTVVILVVHSIWLAMRKRTSGVWSVLSVLCTGICIFLCLLASSVGTLVFEPEEAPDTTVARFMNAFLAHDEVTALSCLSSPIRMDVPVDGETPSDQFYRSSLLGSYSYEVLGEAVISGHSATQQIRFTYLDLKALVDPISTKFMSNLNEIIATRKNSEIYVDDEHYRDEILEEAYHDAVVSVLLSANQYYTDVDITLNLDYADGVWKIRPDSDLELAISGGLAQPEVFANNTRSEALSEVVFIPKHYTIDEYATVAPAPNPAKYGRTTDIAEIEALYAEAAQLIGDQEPFWDSNADFTNTEFRYYLDDTIFTVAWKEIYEDKYCAFAEVYVADPSQIRRKFSEDTFGSPVQKPASALSAEANAVIALNGDFYRFRSEGITVYQRELYRFNPSNLEFCHIDTDGNLNFTYYGDLEDEDAVRRYVAENDILFTLAFGPVLVADGEVRYTPGSYRVGQTSENYSRSSLGQRGEGHYLLMNINYGYGKNGATINQAADIMHDKGCYNAYALDGGQTAEIVIQNDVFNAIDYGNERIVSDIIYFATALPEDENE